jgi:uncharacterized RDD family membrane protein YckC
MSDVSQGEGWWMASDGKWYPPHLHPSVMERPPPPPAAPVSQPSNPSGAAPTWGAQPGQFGGQMPAAPAWPQPSPYVPYPPGYGPPPGASPMAGVYNQDPNLRIDDLLHLALAPWWKRFLAFLIDSLVLGTGVIIIFTIIGATTRNTNSSTNNTASAGQLAVGFVGLFVLFSIPYMLYYGIMNGSKRGQTLGKMALSIAVRDARTGGPIGFWRGVGRYAITIVFYVVLVVPYIIDNLSPLWDARRQAWHDKVVHTVVVDLKP